MKEVMTYVTNDGTIFADKDVAIEYERKCKDTIVKNFCKLFVSHVYSGCEFYIQYNNLPFSGGSEDDLYALVKIRDQEDVSNANKYIEMVCNHCNYEDYKDRLFTKEDIGKEFICYVGELTESGEDYCYFYNCGTIDEIVEAWRAILLQFREEN